MTCGPRRRQGGYAVLWPETPQANGPTRPHFLGTGGERGEAMTFRLFVLSVLALAQIGLGRPTPPRGATRPCRCRSSIQRTIVLSENPSTGYAWQVDTAGSSNLAIVRVNDAGYQPGQNGLSAPPARIGADRGAGSRHSEDRVRLRAGMGARGTCEEPYRRGQRNPGSVGGTFRSKYLCTEI